MTSSTWWLSARRELPPPSRTAMSLPSLLRNFAWAAPAPPVEISATERRHRGRFQAVQRRYRSPMPGSMAPGVSTSRGTTATQPGFIRSRACVVGPRVASHTARPPAPQLTEFSPTRRATPRLAPGASSRGGARHRRAMRRLGREIWPATRTSEDADERAGQRVDKRPAHKSAGNRPPHHWPLFELTGNAGKTATRPRRIG